MHETERWQSLQDFVSRQLDASDLTLERASSDASFRSYWRVRSGSQTFIVMDAPPSKEDIRPWLHVAGRLERAGLHVPAVRAADPEHGFILMSDLGDTTYLSLLHERSAQALYGEALEALVQMQQNTDTQGMSPYHAQKLQEELSLFPEWFLQRHLGLQLDCGAWERLERVFEQLVQSALEQPRCFVHRDFHSRNLMRTQERNPAIIDFQDAVLGPFTYDLVSLLRDCYVEWPEARIEGWLQSFAQRSTLVRSHGIDATRLQRWFDWMGLQRHLKVLGIFCRLWYRDGKAGYLQDLERVLRYACRVSARYPALQEFSKWLSACAGTRDLALPRDLSAHA